MKKLNVTLVQEDSMGLFKKIKKLAKKALGIASPFIKPIKGVWDNLTGKTAAKNMAATQESQLRQQTEQAKLSSMNELDNVTQFDSTADLGFAGTDNRRKRRSAGGFSSGIGLNI